MGVLGVMMCDISTWVRVYNCSNTHATIPWDLDTAVDWGVEYVSEIVTVMTTLDPILDILIVIKYCSALLMYINFIYVNY